MWQDGRGEFVQDNERGRGDQRGGAEGYRVAVVLSFVFLMTRNRFRGPRCGRGSCKLLGEDLPRRVACGVRGGICLRRIGEIFGVRGAPGPGLVNGTYFGLGGRAR